jgi:hypothetical protein
MQARRAFHVPPSPELWKTSEPWFSSHSCPRRAIRVPQDTYLAEGKKFVPVDVLASAYKKFLDRNNPPPVSATSKGGKGKGKGKFNMIGGNQKARWPSPKTEETDYDLLMLPHPDIVNRDDETYVIQGPAHRKVRVTKENWNTLRFNTKSMSPEYFPSSYLDPVATVSSETEDVM